MKAPGEAPVDPDDESRVTGSCSALSLVHANRTSSSV